MTGEPSDSAADRARRIRVIRSASRLGWIGYLGRRTVGALLVLLSISLLTFVLLHAAPGDAATAILGPKGADPAAAAQIRAEYHLDDPLPSQFAYWLGNAMTLDFGRSIRTREPVVDLVGPALLLSLEMASFAMVLSLVVGVPLGIYAALHRGGFMDRLVVSASVAGLSSPPFIVGFALIWIFAYTLQWLPSFGAGSGLVDRFSHLALPSVALAFTSMALLVKMTRASLITALESDYVLFARARGIRTSRVIVRHALQNALTPVLTAAGLVFVGMLSAAVLLEVLFGLPGLGNLLVQSVRFKDTPAVQALVVVFALAVTLVNLVVDSLQVVVDPRIGLTAQKS